MTYSLKLKFTIIIQFHNADLCASSFNEIEKLGLHLDAF